MKQLTLNNLITRAEQTTHALYDGVRVPHRSCGIALAETFRCATAPYQSLRKGGITGRGECGAIKAGELILGELLGDPDPTGAVTDVLRSALFSYRDKWEATVDKGQSDSIVCNDLTGQFAEFRSDARHQFCTQLAATASRCVAEVLAEHGIEFDVLETP